MKKIIFVKIFNQLNGWKMAITTNDILFQMVRSEMTKNTKEDKFTRVSLLISYN